MRQHAGHALANVLSGERHALRRQVVGLDVVADGLAEPGSKAVFVGSPGTGWDAIDVASQVLVGRFGPLQHELRPNPVVLLQHERRFVHGLAGALRDDLPQVIDEAFLVLKHGLGARRFVIERHLHTAMQVAGDLQSVADGCGLELDLRKDCGIGMKVDGRPGAAGSAQLLQRSDRLALLEPHLPLVAIAPDGRDQLARERVDHARADAVQPAGGLVIALLELSTGMEHREDHLERRLFWSWDAHRPESHAHRLRR